LHTRENIGYKKVVSGKRRMKVEKWDCSNEKAKELTITMFGAPEEVYEMAKPIRTAGNRIEAAQILKIIAANGLLINTG
jgi:NTP pyrophosphatase (non-canonical NTP hydrolase)